MYKNSTQEDNAQQAGITAMRDLKRELLKLQTELMSRSEFNLRVQVMNDAVIKVRETHGPYARRLGRFFR